MVIPKYSNYADINMSADKAANYKTVINSGLSPKQHKYITLSPATENIISERAYLENKAFHFALYL